jgi:bacteriocin-like protein
MIMNDSNDEARELNDEELNAVTGGGIVDSVVGVATQIWKIITSPSPGGVKGEAKDRDHQGY